MKKIIYFLILSLYTLNPIFAKDYFQYCSVNNAQKTFSGNIASISGVNFLSRNIIEHEISKNLEKETNSKFKINIDNFYGVNVLKGEFKSLKANSKNFNYKGFYTSNLNIETLCPYNSVIFDNNELFFKENMVLKYSTEITQQDLNKTFESSEYKTIIDKMNNDKIISSILKIQNSNAEIKDDKLIFKYEIMPTLNENLSFLIPYTLKPTKLTFSTNLKVNEGKLELCDFELNSKKYYNGYFLPIINLLNPLKYAVTFDKNNKGENEIQTVKIADSKISINGIILIKKNH